MNNSSVKNASVNNMPIIQADPAWLKELGVQPFDITNYLKTDEDIAEFLSQVLEEGDRRKKGRINNWTMR